MANRQVIQHFIVVDNSINNKYTGSGKPLVFGNGFNGILYAEAFTEKIEIRKQSNAQKNDNLPCRKQFIQEREFFFGFEKFAEKNKIKEKAKAQDNKIKIALKIIIKINRGF